MQDTTLRTAVVSADNGFRAAVAEVLRAHSELATVVTDLVMPAASLTALEIDRLQSEEPEVVLVDMSGDPPAGIRILRLVGDASPHRTLIGTGPALAPELLLEGMRAGLAEYLPSPVDPHDLADAIRRAARRIGRGGAYGHGAAGRVITFVGSKGGTGVTTAAVNTAICLHTAGQRRTLLVDLNFEGGNLAVTLGLKPRYSIVDLLESFHRVDESLLASLVVKHASGVEVLASPLLPEAVPSVSGDQVRAALRLLARQYDDIVIDLARPYSEPGRAAIDSTDVLFLMIMPDVLAIHGAKRLIPLIRKGIQNRSGRLEVVLNQAAPDDEVSRTDAQEALDVKNIRLLRREESVLASVNRGEPVAANGRRSRYGRDILALCALADQAASGRRGTGVRRLLNAFTGRKPKPGVSKS